MFSRINPDSDMTMYIYDCIENGEYDELNDYLNKNNINLNYKSELVEDIFPTPLSFAITVANSEFCELLIKHGADPNIPGFNIHIAIEHHDLETFKILLKYGANPNVPEINGHTPLQAIMWNY